MLGAGDALSPQRNAKGRENTSQFEELLRFGKQLGLSHMSCNSLNCSGRGAIARRNGPLSEEELRDVLVKALDVARETGIKLWFRKLLEGVMQELCQ